MTATAYTTAAKPGSTEPPRASSEARPLIIDTDAEALRAVGAGHEPDWKALAMQMFYPLQSSPCRCSHRWEKGVITRVNHCSRCVALIAYADAIEVSI